ncbi:hypothetical protein J437_LFUL005781 [Ladona fulva]|uniref:PDEase domain-containing protein n=1 Tax=Ladona fulva TaxID=123851 RepID=A0A8K0NWU8_LADFU|nr:hypothetical protein J437_LFUL005781 [Ladona fulva]
MTLKYTRINVNVLLFSIIINLCVCACMHIYNAYMYTLNIQHLGTLREEECNILQNLSREDFREFRGLVIDMVLATDMSFHFQQIKNMRNLLTLGESSVDKSKAVSLVLHCCDISHPAKRWDLHRRWTALLLEEFFLQGDKERELGLPFSPLCDRNNTLVAESQIGFIEFIVEPSMAVCSDMLETILAPLNSEATKEAAEENVREKLEGVKTEEVAEEKSSVIQESKENSKKSSTEEDDATKLQLAQSSGSNGATTTSNQVQASTFTLKKPWVASLMENKKRWKEQAVVDAELRQKQQEEAKQLEEGIAEGDESSSDVCDSNASKEDLKTRTTTE